MAEMTFWDHLDELRKVLFRVVGVWFVLAIGYFIAMPYLFDHVILVSSKPEQVLPVLERCSIKVDLL